MHTKGPWSWHPQDHSMAILSGEDMLYDHVLSVGPCGSCIDRAKKEGGKWKFGRCTTPKIDDARLIAAAPELLVSLKETRDAAAFMAEIIVQNGLTLKLEPMMEKLAGFGTRANTAIAKAEGRT